MRHLNGKILIAGLFVTTSTFAYAQAISPWPEYHEGFKIDGTPTPQPHSACERKLIRNSWLWECNPAARGNPFRHNAVAPSGAGPTMADAGGVRYYNALSANGRRTRAPSRDCVIVQYERDLLWTCPPLTTASIGSPAPAPQGAAAGNIQYYSAVSSNGRRTRAPNSACTLVQQDGNQLWACPPQTTGALSSGGPSSDASFGGNGRNGSDGSSGGDGNSGSGGSGGGSASNSGGSGGVSSRSKRSWNCA
ncbi:hypothetical protein ACQKLX_09925, partial [Bosea sp. NPDC003192]